MYVFFPWVEIVDELLDSVWSQIPWALQEACSGLWCVLVIERALGRTSPRFLGHFKRAQKIAELWHVGFLLLEKHWSEVFFFRMQKNSVFQVAS